MSLSETVPAEAAHEREEARSDGAAGAGVATAGTRGWADWVLGWLRLETTVRTRVYWAAVVLVGLSVFVPRLLPCVDYPQHLALSDIARRLADPHAPEQASFQLNWLTYNGLFHLLVAKLGAFVPIELAGRIVVAASLVVLGGASLVLVRVLGRPPSHAALFVPALFSFSVGWGFVNYALATAIAVCALVLVARMLRKPSLLTAYLIIAVGLSCAFAHVLAMLLLCLFAAALAPEVAWRAAARPGRSRARQAVFALLRMAGALAPLLVGCAFCIGIYQIQYDWDPNMYRDPTIEGTSPPIWQKLALFGSYATDLHSDRSDQVIVWAVIAVILAAVVVAVRRRRRLGRSESAVAVAASSPDAGSPPIVLPVVLVGAAYLATPMVLIGTHLIFPRLAQPLLLAAVLAIPTLGGRAGERLARAALGLGALAAVNLDLHCAIFAAETNDVSRVIDELPAGRRATAVVFESGTFAFRNGTLVHLAAYYAARKHGEWAFAFARYLSVPVRFRDGTQPAWPAKGWEFTGEDYDPRCKYARYYDLVIVRQPKETPDDPAAAEAFVRQATFKRDAAAVKLLSHHGAFWAFDTKGLPEDGTL